MKETKELPSTLRIRRGGTADVEFVRAVAVDVFGYLGDYGRILPTWLLHDGVMTHIAEDGGRAVGYTMLGFYPIPKDEFVADLLAIAVAPAAQGRGVGKRLLEHAIQQVQSARRRLPIRELRLSVADSNARARKMFESFGFTLLDGDHGYYDGGQLALHMTRKI
jgi:ribosomal protein S18 acetylase RimI-like enzyme